MKKRGIYLDLEQHETKYELFIAFRIVHLVVVVVKS